MTEPIPDAEEPRADPRPRSLQPPRRRGPGAWLPALLLLAAAAGAWFWWQRTPPAPSSEPTVSQGMVQPAPATSLPAAEGPAGAASQAPAAAEPPPGAAPLAEADVPAALAALFGDATLAPLLIGDDFVRRFVVTVDNLDREHAAARLWPLKPTAARFRVLERGGQLIADPANAERYRPLVQLAERIDARAAAALYARLLPQLQLAYEELGYPGRRFHARLLAVIDHLLAAPQPPEPLPLRLVDVKSEFKSTQPWLRYEFADPALQSASAGHKILLRIGRANAQRLTAVLRALRAEL
ncbi:MAG TPA: DUF3014 domain-containing protein [Rubrivivax sp.]|nr:DUF3014 domain-containing protein [Rubrivivax sp.]